MSSLSHCFDLNCAHSFFSTSFFYQKEVVQDPRIVRRSPQSTVYPLKNLTNLIGPVILADVKSNQQPTRKNFREGLTVVRNPGYNPLTSSPLLLHPDYYTESFFPIIKSKSSLTSSGDIGISTFSRVRAPVKSKERASKTPMHLLLKNLKEEISEKIIPAAKDAWIQNEPERAEELLANVRREVSINYGFWSPYFLIDLQVFFDELQGNFVGGLKKFEESLAVGIYSMHETIPQRIHRLNLLFQLTLTDSEKYRINYLSEFLVIHKKNTPTTEDISLIVNLAKFAHFSSQFIIRDRCFELLENYIELKQLGSFLFKELEGLAVDIGEIFVLERFNSLVSNKGSFIRINSTIKFLRQKLTQDFISLSYLEGAGRTSCEDLKKSYQFFLKQDETKNIAKYIQYYFFLIRMGEVTEARIGVQNLLDSECFTEIRNSAIPSEDISPSFSEDYENNSHKLISSSSLESIGVGSFKAGNAVKHYRFLMLKCIQLLINSGFEVEAMEKLEEFTKDFRDVEGLIEKAFLYLNPLSQFYDIREGEKIYANICENNLPGDSPELILLGYRIAILNRADVTPFERALQLISREFSGFLKILMCGYSPQLPIHERCRLLFDLIKENQGENFLKICDRRQSGSLDDAFALAKELYNETNSLALYQKFIFPTGICYGNLSKKMETFTPSQKICALFET